jgi:hypothetical protein
MSWFLGVWGFFVGVCKDGINANNFKVNSGRKTRVYIHFLVKTRGGIRG